MKKLVKWGGIVLLTPVLLFAVCALLLYFPPFQNWAIKQVTAYASEKTGMEISIGHVHLVFPLNLGMEEVRVLQQNDSLPQVKDTVANIRKLVANVQLLPLFTKNIEVDELLFRDMKVNTTHFIHQARIKGFVGALQVQSHGIDLGKEILKVNKSHLADARLDIQLSDTVPPDTSKKENFWKIYVNGLDLKKTAVTVHMPGDTLQVYAYLDKFAAEHGFFDLYKGIYRVNRVDWQQGQLAYDNHFKTRSKGLDLNHIALSRIVLGVDSFFYCKPKLSFKLRTCGFVEKSGIEVSNLTGPVSLDSTKLILPALSIRTPESNLTARVDFDLNTFADRNPGHLKAIVHGSFGKQDLLRFLGGMPPLFMKKYPNYPLKVDGVVNGNMNRVHFTGLSVSLPTAFRLKATGHAENLSDLKHLRAHVNVGAQTYNLDFVTSFLSKDMSELVRIPSGINLKGIFDMDGSKYGAKFVVQEGGGNIRGMASLDSKRMAYVAKLSANHFPLQHFLPRKGLNPFTGYIDAKGVGTDFLAPSTYLHAKANIGNFHYQGYDLSHIHATASIRRGVVHAFVDSHNPLLKGVMTLDALTGKRRLQATVVCDLSKADLYHLRITDQPMIASGCGKLDITSDLRDYFQVNGNVGDMAIQDKEKLYRPDDIDLDVITSRDTTHAIANCGDFHLNMDAKGGYRKLLQTGNRLLAAIKAQINNRTIDQIQLRKRLPLARIYLTSGKDNFFMDLLHKNFGIEAHDVYMNMTSSPLNGLNGKMEITSLVVDSVLLDTVKINLRSDKNQMTYSGQIRNNQDNPQYTFNALFDGGLSSNGVNLSTKIYDGKDKLGIGLGIAGHLEPHGLRFRFVGDDPVLGYKTFHVNDDNYVFLEDDRRVSAQIKLKANDGTGVMVYTNDSNKEAMQDITFTLNQFDLEKVMSVLPYTPQISGTMNGDFHLIQTKEQTSISSDLSVDNMVYEHCPMGDIGTEFVYMPKADGSHYVDGMLTSSGVEVATLKGTYQSSGGGYLDATLGMDRTPLSLINGLIPKQIIGLKGYGEGNLTVKGPLSAPQVDGEVYLDSAYLFSMPYGVELRFDNDPVRIVGSHLLFENFSMYAHNDSPLDIYGYLDFSHLDNMYLDVKMRAKNYELIDSKENLRSEAYGKAYVDYFGIIQGPVSALKMRGKLDVLGATDMTYVLRDSPLSTDNRLDGLVEFTSFSDSTAEVAKRPELDGLDMDMQIGIDESAHIFCSLNSDRSNYVDLIGGGNLRLQYNPIDELRLTGKYTLSNGEMKYSLPVIPLKTFTIQDGSYIEFTGDPYNPRLNITATERTKAPVSGDGGASRSVTFDCGVVITKTLKDMGLQFVIDAPEDLSLHNELQTMSVEDRGKLAVTMLTTGMYLADGNTSGFTLNSALSSFLQNQINNISGNALKTLDISFGLDNTTDVNGIMHTDYSFKFAKRFWNNRLRIVVGGKVSTGNDVSSQDQSFFDNVTFEYRMSQASNKYLKLFYERDSYDWLEGYVSEFGAGFLWRRKLQHFKDLFRFGNDSQTVPPASMGDSIKITNHEYKK